jgi:hypothetical protein
LPANGFWLRKRSLFVSCVVEVITSGALHRRNFVAVGDRQTNQMDEVVESNERTGILIDQRKTCTLLPPEPKSDHVKRNEITPTNTSH